MQSLELVSKVPAGYAVPVASFETDVFLAKPKNAVAKKAVSMQAVLVRVSKVGGRSFYCYAKKRSCR